MALLLVGDLGGTHCRLALAERGPDGVRLVRQHRYVSGEAAGLVEIVQDFLAPGERPRRACLAVAGPTDGRRVRFTNLDWEVDAETIRWAFGLEAARLINDFAAVGHGLEALTPAELHTLQTGPGVLGAPRLALGAGTGLGVVQCLAQGGRYQPLASEGGHIAFAPVSDEQISLLNFLRAEYGRVSLERILSGPGIAALYRFCRIASGRPLRREREPEEVTGAALAGNDPAAMWAMTLFARIYGQAAGDLALVTRSTAGVYLAGGIAPKILPFLEGGAFLAGFRGKGRFSAWMETLPVHVILDPDVGLKGAALAAADG